MRQLPASRRRIQKRSIDRIRGLISCERFGQENRAPNGIVGAPGREAVYETVCVPDVCGKRDVAVGGML